MSSLWEGDSRLAKRHEAAHRRQALRGGRGCSDSGNQDAWSPAFRHNSLRDQCSWQKLRCERLRSQDNQLLNHSRETTPSSPRQRLCWSPRPRQLAPPAADAQREWQRLQPSQQSVTATKTTGNTDSACARRVLQRRAAWSWHHHTGTARCQRWRGLGARVHGDHEWLEGSAGSDTISLQACSLCAVVS